MPSKFKVPSNAEQRCPLHVTPGGTCQKLLSGFSAAISSLCRQDLRAFYGLVQRWQRQPANTKTALCAGCLREWAVSPSFTLGAYQVLIYPESTGRNPSPRYAVTNRSLCVQTDTFLMHKSSVYQKETSGLQFPSPLDLAYFISELNFPAVSMAGAEPTGSPEQSWDLTEEYTNGLSSAMRLTTLSTYLLCIGWILGDLGSFEASILRSWMAPLSEAIAK